MTQWQVVTAAQKSWYRFWQDCRAIPKQAWSRWWQTLAIGLGISALLSLGLTLAALWLESRGLQTWDERMLPILAERLPLSFAKSITWESPGNLIGMVPAVSVFVLIMVWRSRPLLAVSMLAAYGLQFALVWIGWGLWNRDRPSLIANGIAAPGLHSFPSGHATVITVVYGLMAYLWLRSSRSRSERLLIILLYLFWVGMVSIARLELGVHWPSDLIVGWVLGLTWLGVIAIALHRAEAAMSRSRLR